MKNALLLGLGLVVLVAVACKKDKDEDKAPPTAAELVVSNVWKIDTMGIDSNLDGTIDTALPEDFALDSCDLDNTLTFSADSTGVFSNGALKCDDSDEDTVPIEWYLKDSAKIINIAGLPDPLLNGDVRVVTLTADNFVLLKPIPVFNGIIVALKK